MKRLIITAFLIASAFGFAEAQKKKPAPVAGNQTGPVDSIEFKYDSFPGDPLNTRRYTLNNGLTVYLSKNTRTPKVQAMMVVRAGSKNDPADNTGLAHYLEHMLFKGTINFGTKNYMAEDKYLKEIEKLYEIYRKTDDTLARKILYQRIDSISYRASRVAIANEYDKMMQLLGVTGTNAYTSNDETVYINDIPSNQIYKWVEIEAERFRSPVFRLFHTELEAVYEEKNRSLDSDNSKVFEKLFYATFLGHPYGQQTTIGTVEHLKNPSLKAIRRYFHRYYVPSNMALILSGDFDQDSLIQVIDNNFSRLGYAPKPEDKVPPIVPNKAKNTYEVVGPNPAFVAFAYLTPSARVREAGVQEVVNELLYNGKAGLLDVNLNLNQKVQSAQAFPYLLNDAGTEIFIGVPKEGQSLEQVEQLILEQLEKLKKGEFDEQLLRAIVNNKEAELLRSYKANYNRASVIADAFILGYTWEEYQAILNAYKSVTKKDVIDFANKYFEETNMVVVYKREGVDSNMVKIEKPKITPIELNKGKESEWLKTHAYKKVERIQPDFVNFKEDLGRTTTSNGLDFFHVENKDNGLFSLYYVLEMGSYNDLRTAYAIELLPYLGTEKYTVDELNKKFYTLAANFGVTSTSDRIYVYLNGLDKNFDESLELFEHLLRNAKPDQEALNKLVERTLKSRADAKKSKSSILFSAMMNHALYGEDNPYKHRLTEEQLKSLKADEMVDLIKGILDFKHYVFYYGPKKIESAAKAVELAHAVKDTLKGYPVAKPFTFRDAPKNNTVFFIDYDMVQAEILWVRKDGPYNEEEEAVADLFNEYFDGGMGTVVFQELRESKALAYSTYANYRVTSRLDQPNYVLAYIGTQSDKLMDAVPAMNALFNTPPSNEEAVDAAKTGLKQKYETSRTLEESIFFRYLSAKRMGRDFDINEKIYENLDALTMADLAEFQQNHFMNKDFYYCIIGSKDRIKMEDLEKIGEVKILTLEEVFGY